MGLNTSQGKLIAKFTANNSAIINFDDIFSANFRNYFLKGTGITTGTDATANLDLVFGTDGVDDTGAADYEWIHTSQGTNLDGAGTTYAEFGDASDAHIDLQGTVGMEIDAGSHMAIDLYIDRPFDAAFFTYMRYNVRYLFTSGYMLERLGFGRFQDSAKSHTDLLLTPANAIALGDFEVYGLR